MRSERRKLEADVREWLTTFDLVSLDPVAPLEPNAEYYVRVVLTTRPRRNVSFWSILGLGREEIRRPRDVHLHQVTPPMFRTPPANEPARADAASRGCSTIRAS